MQKPNPKDNDNAKKAYNLLLSDLISTLRVDEQQAERTRKMLSQISNASQVLAKHQGLIHETPVETKELFSLPYVSPLGPLSLVPQLFLTERAYRELTYDKKTDEGNLSSIQEYSPNYSRAVCTREGIRNDQHITKRNGVHWLFTYAALAR